MQETPYYPDGSVNWREREERRKRREKEGRKEGRKEGENGERGKKGENGEIGREGRREGEGWKERKEGEVRIESMEGEEGIEEGKRKKKKGGRRRRIWFLSFDLVTLLNFARHCKGQVCRFSLTTPNLHRQRERVREVLQGDSDFNWLRRH